MFDQKIDENVFESELLRSCEQQQPFWCLGTRFLLPNKHKKRKDLMTGPRKLSPFCRGVAERGCPRGGFRCYKRPPVDTCTHSWVASVKDKTTKLTILIMGGLVLQGEVKWVSHTKDTLGSWQCGTFYSLGSG